MAHEGLRDLDHLIQEYGALCRKRKPDSEVLAKLAEVRGALEALKADALSWRSIDRMAAKLISAGIPVPRDPDWPGNADAVDETPGPVDTAYGRGSFAAQGFRVGDVIRATLADTGEIVAPLGWYPPAATRMKIVAMDKVSMTVEGVSPNSAHEHGIAVETLEDR